MTSTTTTTKLIFDIEGDNLLRDIKHIWCICISDLTGHTVEQYYGNTLYDGLLRLSHADIIIGHNICGFDIPAITKLYPAWTYKSCRDTLCMSKLFYPERSSHSLENYGEEFGILKPVHEDWSRFSYEMLVRCTEDVKINSKLYTFLVAKNCTSWDWLPALMAEQEDTTIQAQQELNGVNFDLQKALDLVASIDQELTQLDKTILSKMKKKVQPVGVPIMKPFNKDGSLSKKVQKFINEV